MSRRTPSAPVTPAAGRFGERPLRGGSPSAPAAPAWFGVLLDRVLFYVLLAVLATRPLLAESFAPLELSFAEALRFVGQDTSPAATVLLDTVLLLAAGIALARSAVQPRRSPGIAVGLLLLTAAVLISTAAAGNKHVALLAGTNLVATVAAGAALASLSAQRWQILLVIAALAATGTATAIKCLQQELYEFPDTIEFWQHEQKPALIARGVDPSDPLFINYERRLMAQEPHGYLTHPNVTASVLAMSGLALLGLALAAGARRRPDATAVLALLAAATAAVAIRLTGSLGAMVAKSAGVIVLLLLGVGGAWIARHARATLAVFIAGYLAIIAAGVSYGVVKGTLPHPSLAFRWYYWTAAGRAYLDAPATGLGRENFLQAYLRHKPPESTEDVRNPHNLWLSLLVELGPLGLLAGVVLVGAVLHRSIGGLAPAGGGPVPADDSRPVGEQRLGWRRAVPVAVGVVALHAALSGTPFGAPGVALLWSFDFAAKWVGAFALFCWMLGMVPFDEGARRWLAAGLIAGMVAALVQGLLSFGLLTPGGLAVFTSLAVAGTAQAARRETSVASRVAAWGRWPATAATFVMCGAYVWFVGLPTAAGVAAPTQVRAELRRWRPGRPAAPPADMLERILARTGWDPAPPRQVAREVLGFSQSADLSPADREAYLRVAAEAAEAAQKRNPRNPNHFALLGHIDHLRAVAADARGDASAAERYRGQAAQSWQQAAEGNPTDPRVRISAAEAWGNAWQHTGDADAARRAREHLERALAIDARRPAADTARLQPAELARLRSLLDALDGG